MSFGFSFRPPGPLLRFGFPGMIRLTLRLNGMSDIGVLSS